MDFVSAQLRAFPDAHIYHYAPYEETAIKRLAMVHGTREAEVDHLLRTSKLVDLYRVVRESIQVSEPKYSIKNLEVFYRPPREGEVATAGESVVMYERWRKLGQPQLLAEIEDYNRVDCISTLELRDWLLTMRPSELPWHGDRPSDPDQEAKTAERVATEQQTVALLEALRQAPAAELPFRELVGHLLDFHKRESKPGWWFQFSHCEMPVEELIDDSECLGGLERDATVAPLRVKQSWVHTFSFPAQDFKIRKGGKPRRASPNREPAGEIVALDEQSRRIQLKIGPRSPALPDRLSLIPEEPMPTKVLREAILRYTTAILSGDARYGAVTAALRRELPRIAGVPSGAAVIPVGVDPVPAAVRAIEGLEASTLLIQGPPGAGKTYLSAHAIVALLGGGRRVAIASNSHKAVNRLLAEVAELAVRKGVALRGVKKCSQEEHECPAAGIVQDFPVGDRLISRVGDHLEGVTGGAVGDDS